VVGKMKGVTFDEAKITVAEMIGRADLIKNTAKDKLSRSDAASLLNPTPASRDDQLSLELSRTSSRY